MSVTTELVNEPKTIYTCSEHGIIQTASCHFCDKCPHGITRHGHCDRCNDFDWMKVPINRAEFEELRKDVARHQSTPFRHSPYPRQYVVQSTMDLLLSEFQQLKGW